MSHHTAGLTFKAYDANVQLQRGRSWSSQCMQHVPLRPRRPSRVTTLETNDSGKPILRTLDLKREKRILVLSNAWSVPSNSWPRHRLLFKRGRATEKQAPSCVTPYLEASTAY